MLSFSAFGILGSIDITGLIPKFRNRLVYVK